MDVINMRPELEENFGCLGFSKQANSNAEVRVQAKPINLILAERKPLKFIKPRYYQEELCRQAIEGNKIIYLGTGLGKTFIVVMLLKDPSISYHIAQGRRAIFLAPTQDLVKQQAEYIHSHVPYKVKVYCGRTCNAGLHIDNWKKEIWDEELKTIELLFMTPAILCQALAVNVLSWDNISLVIFDEAHHAATTKKERSGKSGGSEYSRILRHFEKVGKSLGKRIKFIGLTASLINDMPNSPESIRLSIKDLEIKFLADCITDLSAIESKPVHVVWTFNQSHFSKGSDPITSIFEEYSERFEEVLSAAKIKNMSIFGPQNETDKRLLAYSNRLRLAAMGFSIKPSSFHKVLRQLAAIRASSGLWTLGYICYNLSKAMGKQCKLPTLSPNIKPVFIEFGNILQKVTAAILELMGYSKRGVLLDYSQPKLMCLLDILKDEYNKVERQTGPKESFSCIVFVKSRPEVKAIHSWLEMVSKYIDGYDFIKAQYAIGLSATLTSKWACITRRKSTEQSSTLEDFRRGKLNVIVTTSVLEEGIDLPVCSTVIRYDQANTFRVYVQSRGRARQKESTYVDMCEAGNRRQYEEALDKFNDFEEQVKEVLQKKDMSSRHTGGETSSSHLSCGSVQDEFHQDYFSDPAKNIFMATPDAKTILHMYCARLIRNCPFSDTLQFRRQKTGELYQTTLYFPAGCPVKDSITGKPKKTVELADSSAVIAAYKTLYEAGELDDHGIPVRATEEHIDSLLDKFNLKPDFSSLANRLEGEIFNQGDRIFYIYPSKLCNLTRTSLSRDFTTRNYKLLQIQFKASSDGAVRTDAREYFEIPVFGMILDTLQEHENFPQKIWSHYGEFMVDYRLIDANLSLNSHDSHHKFTNYTFRLLSTFLGRFQKLPFSERCLFYLVPINGSGMINMDRIMNAFYPNTQSIRPGDVVRINKFHQTAANATKRFVVDQIRNDLNYLSNIPGCRETFASRLEAQGMRVHDVRQPVVAVKPISREYARTSLGKKVKPDDTSQLNYYLWQCLEKINCDAQEAYQAYNLPEIIYQVYLNELAADLERSSKNSTAVDRQTHTRNQEEVEDKTTHPANNGCAKSLDNEKEQIGTGPDEESLIDDAEFSSSESSESDDEFDDDPESSNSDSDEPRPTNKYLDILARQEFNYQERDKSGLERWDMSEYNVPNLKRQNPIIKESSHPILSASHGPLSSLRSNTLAHQEKIEEILRNYQQGFMGDADLADDNDLYDRQGCTVDLNIEPPLSFDGSTKSVGLPLKTAFIEAITSRRANDVSNLEGLENVGDSYLKYCVSVVLFKYLDRNEGFLTSARSRLVSNKHFCHLAKKNQLGQYAIMNKLDRELFVAVLGSGPPMKNRLRPKDMADMVESLIGASLVHGGEYEAIMTMRWLGMDRIFRDDTFEILHASNVIFSRHTRPLAHEDNPDYVEFLRQIRNQLRKLQRIISYNFNNEFYLVQALTHASAINRHTESYERLEFLGDAILDFLVTMTLYRAGMTKDPGQITSSRSALVNNYTFAKLAIKYKIDVFIQHANHQLYDELTRVCEQATNDPKLEFLKMVDYDRISKTLADVFEALAGAIYLDSGCSLDAVYSIFYPMMKDIIDEELRNPTKNVISQLYELFPGHGRIKFEYFKTTLTDGEESVSCAKCSIHGLSESFIGEGLNNRQAKIRAVLSVLESLPTEEKKRELDEQWNAYQTRKRDQERSNLPRNNRGSHRGGHRGGYRGGQRGGTDDGGHRGAYRGRPPIFRHKRY